MRRARYRNVSYSFHVTSNTHPKRLNPHAALRAFIGLASLLVPRTAQQEFAAANWHHAVGDVRAGNGVRVSAHRRFRQTGCVRSDELMDIRREGRVLSLSSRKQTRQDCEDEEYLFHSS